MESNDDIIETVQGNIKILRYNRPGKKNAINVSMYENMTNILNETARDDNIAVTVLTGTGDYYSSGNDVVAAAATDRSTRLFPAIVEFINAFIKYPKLLVAIVNGPAIGIAATTLPLCDLVFAVEDAFFYTPFTKLAIAPEGCSTITFPKIMGTRKATEMLMFNHKMSAKEALDCGFVNYLFKPEDIQRQVWDKIHEVSKLPTLSVEASKKLLRCDMLKLMNTNKHEMEVLDRMWQLQKAASNDKIKHKSKI